MTEERRLRPLGKVSGRPLLYEQRIDPAIGKWDFTHRIVARQIFGSIPKGWVVHHINGHRFDNAPENLKLMLSTEHWALHALGNAELGKGLERKRTQNLSQVQATKEFKEDLSRRNTEKNSSVEFKTATTERLKVFNALPEVKEAFKKRMQAYNSRPEVRAAQSERAKRLNEARWGKVEACCV